MCLKLPARVLTVNDQQAEVEMFGGMRIVADIALRPDVSIGQYVLVDRGLVIEIIDAGEAHAILAMYDEIGQLLAEADGVPWPTAPADDQTRLAKLTEDGGA
jgi:hydrogenase assembly chaperone HypC/HupF